MLSRGELTEPHEDQGLAVPGYEVFERLDISRRCAGRRLGDGRRVALVCIPTHDWEARAVQDAVDATAALAGMHHRHLLGLHDVIPDVSDAEGETYLVIATAVTPGGSLSAALADRGPLSCAEAVTALIPIGQALIAMHDEGHVHGAITAEVVLFTADGMPLLAPSWMDEFQEGAEREHRNGNLAPEVIEGFEATQESDGYGYAALIWEALTGQSPGWVGARGELEEVAPGLTPSLSRAVGQALLPDPAERTSVEELMECLHGLARPAPIKMAAIDVGGDVPGWIRAAARTTAHSPTRRAKSRASHRQPRSWVPAAVAAMALVVILVACAVVFTQLGPAPSQPTTGSTVAVGAAVPKTEESLSELPPRRAGPYAMKDEQALAIVQRLLDARAGAWVGGDPRALAKAHAAGSPAMAADTQRLRAATSHGDRLQEVTFTVRDGAVLPVASAAVSTAAVAVAGETDSGDTMAFAMSVTVHRDAVTVIDQGGQQSVVPASTDRVTVTVVQQGGGWRFYEWL